MFLIICHSPSDPLSAVDAHVGTHLFERAINGALNNKTRILVTQSVLDLIFNRIFRSFLCLHSALHVLPRADRILVMANGTVSEEGTYSELVNRQGPFSEVLVTFGTAQKDEDETENEQEKQSDGDSLENVEDPPDLKEKEGFVEQEGEQAGGDQKSSGALMQQEERVLGSVSGKGELFTICCSTKQLLSVYCDVRSLRAVYQSCTRRNYGPFDSHYTPASSNRAGPGIILAR